MKKACTDCKQGFHDQCKFGGWTDAKGCVCALFGCTKNNPYYKFKQELKASRQNLLKKYGLHPKYFGYIF